jgi:hypothetical protein
MLPIRGQPRAADCLNLTPQTSKFDDFMLNPTSGPPSSGGLILEASAIVLSTMLRLIFQHYHTQVDSGGLSESCPKAVFFSKQELMGIFFGKSVPAVLAKGAY